MKTSLIVLAVLIVLGGGYYWYTQTTPREAVPAGGSPAAQGKININAVCESALSYMTFPDATSSAAFVADCEAGNRPEVIERYKAQMNYGDGAKI